MSLTVVKLIKLHTNPRSGILEFQKIAHLVLTIIILLCMLDTGYKDY